MYLTFEEGCKIEELLKSKIVLSLTFAFTFFIIALTLLIDDFI